VADQLREAIADGRLAAGKPLPTEDTDALDDEHAAILDSVKKGARGKAANLMKAHITTFYET
jgi:DNA-binding GntR family transcriptional regulator